MNVLVLRLPPESFGTVILLTSVTPWLCSSERIYCLSQSTRSRQRMTPLQKLRVLWGVTETGQPPRSFKWPRQRLWVEEDASRRISPFWRRLTVLRSPAAALSALSIMKGDSFETGWASSVPWRMNQRTWPLDWRSCWSVKFCRHELLEEEAMVAK